MKTSYGRRPTASGARFSKMGQVAGKGSIPPSSRGVRPTTGSIADTTGARPMTAVRGAGFSSQSRGRAKKLSVACNFNTVTINCFK